MRKSIKLAAIAASLLFATGAIAADQNATIEVTGKVIPQPKEVVDPAKLYDRTLEITEMIKKSYAIVDKEHLQPKIEAAIISHSVHYTKVKAYLDTLKLSETSIYGVERLKNMRAELEALYKDLPDSVKKILGVYDNGYANKAQADAAILALQNDLAISKNALETAKAQLTAAYTRADGDVTKAISTAVGQALANAKRAHDEDIKALVKENAQLREDHNSDINTVNGRIDGHDATLAELTASSHTVGVYTTDKFTGYKSINFGNGDTAICSTGVELKTAQQVDLAAICLTSAGKYQGVQNVRTYEGYSTDGSNEITFVRMPYTLKSYHVESWLKNHYNMGAAERKGVRNGPDYQSAILYSNGKVITSDSQVYNNTPIAKKTNTKKAPTEVIVVNKDPLQTNVVNETLKTEVVKDTSSFWDRK